MNAVSMLQTIAVILGKRLELISFLEEQIAELILLDDVVASR
jgi:hypothetical protein